MRRLRRNRKSAATRDHIREARLHVDQLVYPVFLIDGEGKKEEIDSMPGIYRWSVDQALMEIKECLDLGIKSFILFPSVADELKDSKGSYGTDPENFYIKAISLIKKTYPETCIITDVALDPYSSDGHDGIVKDGEIINDETLPVLAAMSLEHARAGADIIGPSDMMDLRVGYIRDELDKEGFNQVSIMSYTAKYASAYYGPFRDALDSAPKEGDKLTYQMDPANKFEALVEADLDYLEGADYLMVKPALLYLDIIHLLKGEFNIPIVAYNVSGEYAMLKAASANNWLEYDKAMPEMLLSIKRAGADVIISYFAKEYAKNCV